MGFFNLLETVFFISLAITFVLIMMLVYHFKGRLVVLEQKCDTMFEIMNNMIKEMKAIHLRSIAASHSSSQPSATSQKPFSGGFPMDLLSMLGGGGNGFSHTPAEFVDEDDDDDDDEDDDDDADFKKIVVSDTEIESDSEIDDENIKVIHVGISEELPDLEEVNADIEIKDDDKDSLGKPSDDYKKMDISYLRTLVITRGLASDTKKLKKADLVKLLSDE